MFRQFALSLLLAAAALAQTKPLTILHVNDIHAQISPRPDGQGGFAYLKATLDRERKDCSNCLVVQAGDLAQGSPISTIFKGLPIYQLSNAFRFDAATLGNHDYDYGWARTNEFLKAVNYPILVSNVVNKAGELPAPPYLILERGGLKLGIIGVMTETLPGLQVPGNLGDYHVLNVVETVRKYARELRPKTDLVILIAHLIPEEETAILEQVPEVAVLIGAHVHTALFKERKEEGRVFARLYSNATEVGRMELQVDTQKKNVASVTWRRISVGRNTIEPDAALAAEVASWESKVAKELDIRIGEVRHNVAKPGVKALCEKALAAEMKADFGFCNQGGMRAALTEGDLLVRHIWDIMPFDNTVVVGRFKGSQLAAPLLQGRTVEPDKEYTVATSNYSAANQDRPGELGTKGLVFEDTGKLMRDVLIDWFKKTKTIE